MKYAEPILAYKLEDDPSPTGGISFVGETVEDFIREDEQLLNSYIKVSELNKFLTECGISPIVHNYRCGDCVRFEKRDVRADDEGYHCSCQDYNTVIQADEEACLWYWDRSEQKKIDKAEREKQESERQARWKINALKAPVKLPIVYDGFGNIPICPTCGEPPYNMEQCYFCGQRFVTDAEVERYNTPAPEEIILCPICGKKTMVGKRSKYNNHFHGRCSQCKTVVFE